MSDYRASAAPFSQRALATVDPNIPVVHFGVNATHLLSEFAQVAATASRYPVLGVDHRISLDEACATLMVSGMEMPVQATSIPPCSSPDGNRWSPPPAISSRQDVRPLDTSSIWVTVCPPTPTPTS